jgi:hypothetical protein
MRRQEAIAGAFGSATSALGFVDEAVPLYMKAKADKKFVKSGDNLASWAPSGTYSSVDAQGNAISTNAPQKGFTVQYPGLTSL